MHELLGRAEARGGRVVAGGLVAPGAVEGVLGDGQQPDVRVAHVRDVAHEAVSELVVGEVGAAGVLLARGLGAVAGQPVVVARPAAQVHLVDVEGALHVGALGPPAHPLGVAPLVAVDAGDARGRLGRLLRPEGVGVRLEEGLPVAGLDAVLVAVALGGAGDEALPDPARRRAGERVGLAVPAVEVAHHADGRDVRAPHGEAAAGDAVDLAEVRPQLPVALVPASRAHQVDVVGGDDAACCAHPCLLRRGVRRRRTHKTRRRSGMV